MSETTILAKKERVVVYVDGFNLYFGMLDAGFDYCKWLNIKLLVVNLLQSNQKLIISLIILFFHFYLFLTFLVEGQ